MKRYAITRLATVGALAAAALCAQPSVSLASSLDALMNMSLEELLDYPVSASTKTEVSIADTPGAVYLISYDQIQRSAAQTIPELLRSVPGVNVRWNPMVQTIDIRGFGSSPFSSRVLLLIDGIPYNSWNKGGFPQHPGFDFFSLANVKHIEVVRGPASALYGENAYNGVINIVTLRGDEVGVTRGTATVGDRDTREVGVTHGVKWGDEGSLLVSARGLRSRLPLMFWSEEMEADARSVDLYLKAVYRNWEASYYRIEDDFDGFRDPFNHIPGFPADAAFSSAEKIEQTVEIAAVRYQHDADDGGWSRYLQASYASRDGSHCANCHDASADAEFQESADHGYQAFLSGQLVRNWRDKVELMVGAEHRAIESGGHSEELLGSTALGQTHNDAVVDGYDKSAAYVQSRFGLFDGRLQLTAGLRHELETSPYLFGCETFPRLSTVLDLNDRWKLKAGWVEAARYPSFSELYQASGFLVVTAPGFRVPLATFTPNPDLRPEQIRTFDLGLDYQSGGNWVGRLNLYRNRMTDLIVMVYPTFGAENHPNTATTSGVELEIGYERDDRLSIHGSWAYQHNSQSGNGTDSQGQPIEFTYSPRHKVNVGLTHRPTEHLSWSVDAKWKDKYTAPSFWYPIAFGQGVSATPLPDYTLLDASLSWRLPVLGNGRPLVMKVSAKNLLNEKPYETLVGLDSRLVGREFFVRLEYQLGR